MLLLSSDLFTIWKFYFKIFWRLFQSNVHLFTSDLWPYLLVLKLFTISWYVDDDLVVWFSGTLGGWNLSLGHFHLDRLLQIRHFKAWWSHLVLVYSFHISVFQVEHLRGGKYYPYCFFLKFFYLLEFFILVLSLYCIWVKGFSISALE